MVKNQPTVEHYKLYASNGRPIRIATKVTLEDGRVIRFFEKLSKSEAIKQVSLIQESEIREAGAA